MPTYYAYSKGLNFRGPEVKNFVFSQPASFPITLTRDPENEHDSNAIQVLAEDIMIGFVEKDVALWLAPRMDSGDKFEAEATGTTEKGKAIWLNLKITQVEETDGPPT